MSNQSTGQKTAKKYTGKAVDTLQGARTDMLSNPLYLLGQQIARQVGEQPLSLPPEIVNLIKSNQTQQTYDAYNGAVGSGLERAGAVGAYRDGSTRQFERNQAADLGGAIGNMNRNVDIQAAMQRNPDMANASNLLNSNLQTKYGFDRDIANVFSGAATNPVWSQQTPKPGALGGLGGIGGSIAGSGFSPGWLVGAA